MKFLNKKSQDAFVTGFYLLFGLMLAAFFIFGVFFKVKAAVDDSSYHKRFFSRDLALLVDSLHASNGNFIVDYEMNYPAKTKLDLGLDPDRVFLTGHSDIPVDERLQTSFRFGYNPYVKIIPMRTNTTIIDFDVVYENDTITFKHYVEDVKLPEPEEQET